MEGKKMSIYEEMKAAGVEIDNHSSDLLVPSNAITRGIVARYEYKGNVQGFKSAIDGTQWLEIPFAFDPFWSDAEKTVETWAKGITA